VKGLLVAATAIITSSVYAGEWPLTGLIFNTKDQASITYDCSRHGEVLDCEFAQVGVRPKLDAAGLRKKLADGANEKLEPMDKKACALIPAYIAWGEGRGPKPAKVTTFKYPEQTADALRVLKAIAPYCESQTRENANAMLRASLDVDLRTCVVHSWTFKQSFTLVSDPGTGKKSWVVKSAPNGACGTVQLDRFEAETISFGSAGSLPGWKYIARKAVTNPAGEAFPGVKCSDLDEGIYEYTSDSRENTRPARCDYIEFSPF
jgi:hypothetical protein